MKSLMQGILNSAIAGLGGFYLLAAAAPAVAQNKPDSLIVLGTPTLQAVSTQGNGGDITQPFQKEQGLGVTWITLDQGPLRDRLFRELGLSQTSIDVAFVLNADAVPALSGLLEPLDGYMAKDPIEDWGDVFGSLKTSLTFDGKTYGIPFRHASSCLHYNKRIFSAAGLQAPTTMEELVADARAVANPKNDVYGLVLAATEYPNLIDFARGWNGDFITTDYRVAATDPGMKMAVTTLSDFYKNGVIPKNWATISDIDVQTWMQSGRAAMTISACGRNRIYNADGTQEAGNIQTVALPISETLKTKFTVAPAKVEYWSVVIPRNSVHKDLAWQFIRNLLSKQSTLNAALNGNGPVRNSTYDEKAIKDLLPYSDAERSVLLNGRVPLPAFDKSAQAADIFVDDVNAAILGLQPVDTALEDIQTQVTALLPSH